MSHFPQSSVQHTDHHGYQLLSTQSQNVTMLSARKPTILNPPQSVKATDLNDSDPTAAQYLKRFNSDQTENFTLL